MKQIFTLFVSAILCLFVSRTSAQISGGFEPDMYMYNGVSYPISPLASLDTTGWDFQSMNWDKTSQITGTGSIYAEATTTSSGTSSSNGMIATPFIDFQNGNVLSIMYKLDSKTATFIKQ